MRIITAMKTSLFDYHLTPQRIAQKSVVPRDHSRLLVLDPVTRTMVHHRFFEIGDFLQSGDLLVMNDTKVFKARLSAKRKSGGAVEVFLLHPVTEEKTTSTWACLLKPGKKIQEGEALLIGRFPVTVLRKLSDGVVHVHLPLATAGVIAFADRHGHIPIPPYVHRLPKQSSSYQTIYAKHTGSVAAPTAGFHFTPQLLRDLKKKGVRFAFVTLHVGLGTFRPMQGEMLEEHVMHAEWAEMPVATEQLIRDTKKKKRRVIAVGTTTVRALEGLLGVEANPRVRPLSGKRLGGKTPPLQGWVNLFIAPGYHFKIVDALITNFHLPKSTLLVLVSAFAGRANILRAYREAIKIKYRFFSFGDAMFLTRRVDSDQL